MKPMNNLYYDHSFGWGFGGALMMIVFWTFVIVLLVWLVKGLRGEHPSESQKSKSGLDILKERYAKGEIDKKEFEERKKTLTE